MLKVMLLTTIIVTLLLQRTTAMDRREEDRPRHRPHHFPREREPWQGEGDGREDVPELIEEREDVNDMHEDEIPELVDEEEIRGEALADVRALPPARQFQQLPVMIRRQGLRQQQQQPRVPLVVPPMRQVRPDQHQRHRLRGHRFPEERIEVADDELAEIIRAVFRDVEAEEGGEPDRND